MNDTGCDTGFFRSGTLTVHVSTLKGQSSRTHILINGELIQILDSNGHSRQINIDENKGKELKLKTKVNDTKYGTDRLGVEYTFEIGLEQCNIQPISQNLGQSRKYEYIIILGENL